MLGVEGIMRRPNAVEPCATLLFEEIADGVVIMTVTLRWNIT